jgi:hypothetical protein
MEIVNRAQVIVSHVLMEQHAQHVPLLTLLPIQHVCQLVPQDNLIIMVLAQVARMVAVHAQVLLCALEPVAMDTSKTLLEQFVSLDAHKETSLPTQLAMLAHQPALPAQQLTIAQAA